MAVNNLCSWMQLSIGRMQNAYGITLKAMDSMRNKISIRKIINYKSNITNSLKAHS